MSASEQQKVQRRERPDLCGWKAIADALGVDPATARRWADRGMPVFLYGPKLIVAYRAELDAWAMQRRPTRVERQQLELPLAG